MPDDVLGRIVATHLSERRHSSSEAQVEAAENGLTHPEHVILTPTRNPSVGERARELLVRANELASAPLPLPRSPLTRTRAARRPNEGMACPATGAEMAPSASEDAAQDVSDSCTICMSSPRAVRFLPCRHAVMCEVCAMTEMKRTGKCSHCRRPVEGLVFVPVTPLRPKRLKTHQDEPEPEAFYQSVQEFLQQATGHRTASEAPGPPVLPRSIFHGLVLYFEPSSTFAGARPGYVFRSGENGMGYYRGGAETSRSAATPRRQLEASSECCPEESRQCWIALCWCLLLLYIYHRCLHRDDHGVIGHA